MSGLLFPPKCIFCGDVMNEPRWICKSCADAHIMIGDKVCMHCGMGLEYCTCGHAKRFYERRIACVYYLSPVRRGMMRFKFHRHTMLGVYYGRLMAAAVHSKYKDIRFDGAVCVPMHRLDRWRRGYNCAELLAREIAKRERIAYLENALRKCRRGRPQKRVKSRDRERNVRGLFQSDFDLRGKTILLVDDIATTGATLNECARILKQAGAKQVYCVSLASVRFSKKA